MKTIRFAALGAALSLLACSPPPPDQPGPGGEGEDTTAPKIQQTVPKASATEVEVMTGLSIEFSEAMDPDSLTITAVPTLTLSAPEWLFENTVVQLTPASPLANGTAYVITVVARDVAGNAVEGGTFAFTTRALDVTPPTLLSSQPAANATAVSPETGITLTFSEPMDRTTVLLTVVPEIGLGDPEWTEADTVVTFRPTAPLDFLTAYQVAVAGRDLIGNALGATSFTFTTGTPPDTEPPTVVESHPADGTTGVSIGTKPTLTFSEPMNKASVAAALSLSPTGTCADFSWNSTDTQVTCEIAADFGYGVTYTVTVGTGAADAAGNHLAAEHQYSFTTAQEPDTTPPTVVTIAPAHQEKCVSRGTSIVIDFSEPMDKPSAQVAFSITSPSGFNGGTFTWDTAGTKMTYRPPAAFAYGTTVSWQLSTVATDVAGNALTSALSRNFKIATLQPSIVATSSASLDGYITNVNGISTTSAAGYVGDDSTGKVYRSFLSFSLTGLPTATCRIAAASLNVRHSSTIGTPTTDLGTLWAQSVNYGPSLTTADYNTAVLQTWQFFLSGKGGSFGWGWRDEQRAMTLNATTNWYTVNVLLKVQDDFANKSTRGSRSQFRIKFNTDATLDGGSDYVGIYLSDTLTTSYRPYLLIDAEVGI